MGSKGSSKGTSKGGSGVKLTKAEMGKKVKYTIGWYNTFGNLQKPIIYKTIKSTMESMNPKEALKILRDLEEKKLQVNNPTRWIKRAAESSGFLDEKVKRTIWWYNDNGNLAQPIHYDEVKKLLGQLRRSSWKAARGRRKPMGRGRERAS